MMSLNEDNYDEINQVLRDIAAAGPVQVAMSRRFHVGSGEDCQIVMFGSNYKRINDDEFDDEN